MKRQKNTKKALFSSILSLVICLSMLIGATFAWFTDSVTSANNIIKSGNLDIELEYWNGTDWLDVKDKSDILTNTLWEPGVTEVAYLRVANAGSLALKYQLGVNIVSEKEGVNQAGDAFKLSDYIMFGVVEDVNGETDEYDTREDAVADVVDEQKISVGYTKTTAMASGAESYFALVVYMPTSVDNVANHNGTDIPQIELGISVFATQVESEEDSFGPEYDENAWHPKMKVSSASELAIAINEIEDGGIIQLAEDLTFDVNSRAHSGGGWYEAINYVGDKSFTIDLNGYSITNDSSINDRLLRFENNGNKANTITIKNGTLNAAPGAYSAIATASSNTQKMTINLENVNANLANSYGSGAVVLARGGAEVNIKAGTVITGANSYTAIECANGIVNIYDGVRIYQNGTSSYCGSLVGVSGRGLINVYGGYGKSVQGAFIAMTSGGTINISGGDWIANNDGTYANGNKSVLIAQSQSGADSIINVTGGNFKGGYNCYGDAVGDAQINISGGNFNSNPNEYIDTGFKAIEMDGEFVVVAEDVDAIASNVTELTTALETGKTVALTNDIDATSGIVIPENATIDGNGNSITYTGTEYDCQLVKLSTNASVKNVTLENYKVRTENATNGVVTLENVVINMDNDQTGLDISRGAGTAKLTNVTCKGTTDAAHLDPNTTVQVDYTPYGDVLLGTKWGLEAVDCAFGSLHGWNTTNGSSVSLTNTTTTVFRMHYWSNRTLYINGVETAWSESGAIPVAHDVGGCWSVQPAFK